jgi:hypothetical protein
VVDDLRDYLTGGTDGYLRRWVRGWTDETRCAFADGVLIEDAGYFRYSKGPSCSKKNPKPCQIEEFWKNRLADLKALRKAKGVRTVEKKMVEETGRSKAGLAILRGRNCTGPLSDAVIYLASGTAVATTNIKDFKFVEDNTNSRIRVVEVPTV